VRLSGAGFLRPKRRILGSDVAGEVEAVGSSVTRFRPGDAVFGDLLYHAMGTFAEYVSVSEGAPLALKPPELSFEEAATLPQAAVLGLQGMRRPVPIEPGDRVMVNGAGGGAGTFALQLAKLYGAEVTGVDSTVKLDEMRSLGADHVIDYTREDFAKSGLRFDRIVDFASHRSIFTYRRVLRPGGRYGVVGGSVPRLLQAATLGWALSKTSDKHLGVFVARPNKEDLAHVADLVVSGDLSPVIDRRFTLAEVPDALGRLGSEQAIGKIVVTMD
jgi:NADPH:quinone reductase-like Zn-dependent oxidoreductase